MWIIWKSSMCDRGNVTMVYGGKYNTDDFRIKVGEHTLNVWLEEGACEEYDPKKHDKKPEPKIVPEPTPKPEPVTVNTEPEFADNEPEPEPTPEPVEEKPEVTILKDDDKFPCTHAVCPKHNDPYTSSYYFIKHMKDKHDEKWVAEGDKIKKV